MKIGIIGVGIVGSAIRYGFERLGHDVYVHDTKWETNIEDVLDTEIALSAISELAIVIVAVVVAIFIYFYLLINFL